MGVKAGDDCDDVVGPSDIVLRGMKLLEAVGGGYLLSRHDDPVEGDASSESVEMITDDFNGST